MNQSQMIFGDVITVRYKLSNTWISNKIHISNIKCELKRVDYYMRTIYVSTSRCGRQIYLCDTVHMLEKCINHIRITEVNFVTHGILKSSIIEDLKQEHNNSFSKKQANDLRSFDR